MKKFLIIVCLSLGMIACSSDDNRQDKGFEPVTLEMKEIMHNYLSGEGREGIGKENRVITTITEWQDLIDQINQKNEKEGRIATVLKKADIDFQNEIILAVFEEVLMNGVDTIDITKVEEQEKEVVVTIERLIKGGITSVITQPFHIVKIPKINKPVVFVEID
ncbi:hypothetical protein [Myroides indicus]|uniref:Lipoprotein n=1 Tax=Myroides indicus TaxID=1323422 RepID=A0A4R7EXD6_9FLAO|nr:hypothetical protein [Myroides indicus]TDS58866.1 hypothetical protein C8P70_11148 [Myroides indicus]